MNAKNNLFQIPNYSQSNNPVRPVSKSNNQIKTAKNHSTEDLVKKGREIIEARKEAEIFLRSIK